MLKIKDCLCTEKEMFLIDLIGMTYHKLHKQRISTDHDIRMIVDQGSMLFQSLCNGKAKLILKDNNFYFTYKWQL